MADNIGLVLEGGGMRGLYTSGVLDCFLEKGLIFPYVIGVSAGACNGLNYISRQKRRSKEVNIRFANDSRYINFTNIFKREDVFGLDFLFEDITNELNPFDFETFNNAKEKFVVCCTDCERGRAVYYDNKNCKNILEATKASSSLPFLNSIVEFDGRYLLDGGIADSIPIKKSIDDGNEKNVIIMTRNRGYRKKPFKFRRLAKGIYKDYESLVDTMLNRYKIYNDTLDYIEELEQSGKVFVIQPESPVNVKRAERDVRKLEELYDQGYKDGDRYFNEIKDWMEK